MPEWLAITIAWTGPIVLIVVIARWVWSRFHPPRAMNLDEAQVIRFPLPEGAWEAFNSPGTKVPSHGTDWLGQRFAIDLVGVDPGGGHSAATDWRTRLWLEPPDRFHGFGAPVVAPGAGEVVTKRDDVSDRRACRSWVGLGWFFASSIALGLIALVLRRPAGTAAVAGNHVVIALEEGGFVALMHLQRRSIAVERGDRVEAGALIGRVGNSGNTTQPHLHLQLTDEAHPQPAAGRPMAFRAVDRLAEEWWHREEDWMPPDGECIRAATVPSGHRLDQDRP